MKAYVVATPSNPDCPATHPNTKHNRAADYTYYGCRCEAARRDREHQRKLRHLLPPRMVDATGARRRLQALMALGHSQNDLNEALGRKRSGSLGPFMWRPGPRQITTDLDRRVREVYDRLWDQPPTGPRAEVVRLRAARHGWPPPMWWCEDEIDDPEFVVQYRVRDRRDSVDPIAVELACSGQPVRLTIPERREVVRRLDRQGLHGREIAARTGLEPRSVVRLRAAIRKGAA